MTREGIDVRVSGREEVEKRGKKGKGDILNLSSSKAEDLVEVIRAGENQGRAGLQD